MAYDPKRARTGDFAPFERQHQALLMHKEHHLEYVLYLQRTREEKGSKWKDYDICRDSAVTTLGKLALIEQAVGIEDAAAWLDKGVARARELLAERETAA
jgi:hypothetical protein